MIVLRKLGGKGITSVVVADPLSGLKDGSNQVFNTTTNYIKDKITIFFNGQALHSPSDFIQSGPKEITFIHVFPTSDSELRAIYEVEGSSFNIDHGALSGLLDDDHPQYLNTVRGDSRYYTKSEINTLSGTLYDAILNHHDEFIGLLDTPTTYSGHEGKYVKVRNDGSGLEFSEIKDELNGKESLVSGATSLFVPFSNVLSSSNYTTTVSLENTIDAEPSIYSTLVSNTTVSGFTVLFSGDMDSPNYKLNWIVKI